MNWTSLIPLGILTTLIMYVIWMWAYLSYLSQPVWTLHSRFVDDQEIAEVNRLGPYSRQRAMSLAIKYNSPGICNHVQVFGEKQFWNDYFNPEKNLKQARKHEQTRARTDKNQGKHV